MALSVKYRCTIVLLNASHLLMSAVQASLEVGFLIPVMPLVMILVGDPCVVSGLAQHRVIHTVHTVSPQRASGTMYRKSYVNAQANQGFV